MPRVLFSTDKHDVIVEDLKTGRDFNWHWKALFTLFSNAKFRSFKVLCSSKSSTTQTYNKFVTMIESLKDICQKGLGITVSLIPYEVEVKKGVPRKFRKKVCSRCSGGDCCSCTDKRELGTDS